MILSQMSYVFKWVEWVLLFNPRGYLVWSSETKENAEMCYHIFIVTNFVYPDNFEHWISFVYNIYITYRCSFNTECSQSYFWDLEGIN